MADTWHFVHMPKTGGSSVIAAMDDAGPTAQMGHTPAHEVAKRTDAHLFGTLRPPDEGYVSFYAHCLRGMKADGSGRAGDALRHYGGGTVIWSRVFWGLTQNSRAPFPGDPLFAPAGAVLVAPLYTTHVCHYFKGGPVGSRTWLVDALVATSRLETDLPILIGPCEVPRKNTGNNLPPALPEGMAVPDEDWRTWEEAQSIMVNGKPETGGYIWSDSEQAWVLPDCPSPGCIHGLGHKGPHDTRCEG